MKKPYIFIDKDESISIGFVKKNKRFTIVVEPNVEDSSWNFVSNEEGVENLKMEYGTFSPEFIKNLKEYMGKEED